jgi:hypothetical protein
MTILELKIRTMIVNKNHLESRTYDYGHNDMQTDIFCKFCNANQAKYITTRKGQRKVNREWHKFDCIVVDVMGIKK